MKIGIYDPYLDTLGGGEKYMASAASCLSGKNQVSLFWDDKNIIKKLHERFLINTFNLTVVPNIFNSNISFIERLKKSRKYDKIFFLSDGSIPILMCKKLYLHFQFPVEWVKPTIFTKLKLSRASSIICNSNFTKFYIDKKLGVKSRVIYPPSSGEDNLAKNIIKEKIILSVGRFNLLSNGSTFKKQEVMFSMFNKLKEKYNLKDWKLFLFISARDEDIPFAQKIISKQGNEFVSLIFNASAKNLQEYYARSSIYWHAAGFGEDIDKHPELAEHFGIATVQAMENGAVPVVIKAGGQEEIIKDAENGYLWTTEEECIEKTYKIIKNIRLWEQVSLNAKKRAGDFSKKLFCDQINSLISL